MNKDQIFKEIASAIYNNPHTEAIEFAEYANYLVLFATEGLIRGVEYSGGIALELTDEGTEKLFEVLFNEVVDSEEFISLAPEYNNHEVRGRGLWYKTEEKFQNGEYIEVFIYPKNIEEITAENLANEIRKAIDRELTIEKIDIATAKEERNWEMLQSVGYTCGIVG